MAFGGPRAVGRVTDVLELLAYRRQGASLASISRLLGIPKASASALLKPLAQRGYVAAVEGGLYRLGPAAHSFAKLVAAPGQLVEVAHPVLSELARDTGETVMLATLAPDEAVAVYIDKAESDNPIRYTVPVGLRRELHASSAGKVLLAFQNEDWRGAFLAKSFSSFTDATITDPEALSAQVIEIRRNGFATTQDERTIGASAIAAPIWNADGVLAASLSLAGPSPRLLPQRDRFVELVLLAARRISQRLGYEADQKKRVG